MVILVDSNVLLRTAQPDSPHHETALRVLEILRGDDHDLALMPQCLYEYYVVATRPVEQNGLGMVPARAARDLDQLLSLFRFYRDERSVFEYWKDLVLHNTVRGKNAHDARLVAAMLRHGITSLLTFNGQDFRRFSEITVLDPSELMSR